MEKSKSKKVKFAWKDYLSPTPKLFRKIGDTLLGVGSLVTGNAIYADEKKIALAALTITIVGKFFTNMFKEDDEN